jgi:hypothetical protein
VSSFAKFKDKDNNKKRGLVKFKDENDKKTGGVGVCKLDLGQDNKGGKGDLNFAKLKDKDK